ncbi:MAG: TetR/AcrR family transcriptional regulator [Deltaproteobacteria bacterium]|nr:TetR/AcrR family transcriptional regulator [Deltaproteobacteria bacterium]
MPQKKAILTKIREGEREVRKNLIIDASVRLFAKKTFNQVGIRDIAAEAGLSPASIYRYFSNRDDLFAEALWREGRIISEEIRHLKDLGTGVSLEQMAVTFVTHLLEHSTFFEMMTHFMITGKIGKKALEKFNDAERKLLDVFDEMFQSIGAQNQVRLLSHAFFASLNGILITFRNYPGRPPEDSRKHILRLASTISMVFTRGSS